MSFSNRLKELRLKRNLSQKTLGEIIGVTRETISKYELGEREPPLSKSISLSSALNVSLLSLADLTEQEYLNLSELDEKTRNDIYFIILKSQDK